MIKMTRIDYRLLHGQVAFAWSNFISADCILIANDSVVNDAMRKATLRLAKPNGCKLIFKNIEDSLKALNSDVTDKYHLFIIVENIVDAKRLVQGCNKIKELNLGLSKKTVGSKRISSSIYINEEEESDIRTMCKKGVQIFAQQGPTDKKIIMNDAIERM
ncbi:PTS sugar transporter subunit IIB [Bombilactobacillus bombi]|uniref:PTS sugar transporter subunit IIB n=1 Tax=Bombilactobacillus bombi TaxID=1303590 RepID=UPI0015E5A9EF|nr:PTS sugar transporter subunit IIB [Bombilactobacillus bombi]MBA1433855.1 PTS mannose/fructose/sorbose transporter subunit IIB [Bombilactobacillus bombi]